MKKILFMILTFIICINVEAAETLELHRGESSVVIDGFCDYFDDAVSFFIDKDSYSCMITSTYVIPPPECDEDGNCKSPMIRGTHFNRPVVGTTFPVTAVNLFPLGDVDHVEGKVQLEELVALMNDRDNETRKSILAKLETSLADVKPEDATKVVLYAGSMNNSIYISVGWDTEPVLIKIDYDEVKNQLSYTNETTDVSSSIVEPIVLYSFYEWNMEASPNYANAKEIRDDETKYSYVDEEALVDGVSGFELSGDTQTGNYSIDFDLVLNDDWNNKIIESYNINSERANEPDDPTQPAQPTPPADSTQPTQPTEPVKQPNTGTYLPLIGVMWLAMFGMVFICCRKTMFKKI